MYIPAKVWIVVVVELPITLQFLIALLVVKGMVEVIGAAPLIISITLLVGCVKLAGNLNVKFLCPAVPLLPSMVKYWQPLKRNKLIFGAIAGFTFETILMVSLLPLATVNITGRVFD